MDGCWYPEGTANFVALVCYLPEPLASLVDRIRCELGQSSECRSHLTLLPPRPLIGSPDRTWDEIKSSLQAVSPIEVELVEVRVFPVSEAVYISVGRGARELERTHALLNRGHLEFREPWIYHPHVTLAQDLPSERIAEVAAHAAGRWSDFTGKRTFAVEHLTFGQNVVPESVQEGKRGRWKDLAEYDLRAVAPV